ncbi:MAG: fumarylacetoacetate hydrolase family protein [Halioglobus sp.]|nr:fumarylacetoacetate hydrolase family protein [Halioglobus sp.]
MKILTACFVLLLLVVAASLHLARPIFDERLDQLPSRSLALAPIEDAVTLAVTRDGAVLLVTAANADGVSGIDLGGLLSRRFDDALHAYRELGYDQLRRLHQGAHLMQGLPWSALGLPVSGAPAAIAAGTNYRAHAEEVGHEGEPFLFPKLSAPTRWDASVHSGSRLDYEVELCAVPVSDYRAGSQPQLGLLLCNDFTDRWLLVRDIDLDGPMGETGFALAKGGATRLPVGPLLVFPRSDDFYRRIELGLAVDGVLRQRAQAADMIWTPREIMARALERCRVSFDSGGQSKRLTGCDRIAAGTLLLTGTPDGVMFKPAHIWAPWAYLRAGDRVTSYGSYLGMLVNEIAEP